MDQGPKITGLGSKGAAERDLVGVNWGASLGLPTGRVAGVPSVRCSLAQRSVQFPRFFGSRAWGPAQPYLPRGPLSAQEGSVQRQLPQSLDLIFWGGSPPPAQGHAGVAAGTADS